MSTSTPVHLPGVEPSEFTLPDGLTDADRDAINLAAADSLAPATRRAYESSLRTWRKWCRDRGVPAIPATPELVAAHLTDLAEAGRSTSTMDRTLAALRDKHLDLGFDDPTSHRGVQRVRSGLRRRLGTAPRQQAHPLSTEEVRRIVEHIDDTELRGLRDRAIVLLGYAAALRRSEIADLACNDIMPRARGVVVRVRRSKSDQEGEGQLVGVVRGQHIDTDPVHAVHAWMERSGGNGSDPLFTRISWSGLRPGFEPLTGASVARILQQRAKAAGLGDLPISGHSLRAGHATTAAEHGVPADRLMRTTRHKNMATLAGYVRPAETLRDTSSANLGL